MRRDKREVVCKCVGGDQKVADQGSRLLIAVNLFSFFVLRFELPRFPFSLPPTSR